MRRIVVDTNVLASFLTDRNEAQQERAGSLIESAVAGELRLVVPQVVATELVYVLTNLYGLAASETSGVLRDVLATPGVEIEDELPWPTVFDFWPDELPAFGDAAIAAVARRGRHEAVATFDRRFANRLPDLGVSSYWSL